MATESYPELRTGGGFKGFLTALREIGWSDWDPIGLSPDRAHCEDEYDSYLLAASGKLANGASEDKVADYLVFIENEHMAMPKTPTTQMRAITTVRRIAALIAM
jgi:hypothetical protein